MRLISVAAREEVEYSVIVRNLLNEEFDVVGEIYGVGVKGPNGFAHALDLTTRQESAFDFAGKLCDNGVTPVTLLDVVYDCLPL